MKGPFFNRKETIKVVSKAVWATKVPVFDQKSCSIFATLRWAPYLFRRSKAACEM